MSKSTLIYSDLNHATRKVKAMAQQWRAFQAWRLGGRLWVAPDEPIESATESLLAFLGYQIDHSNPITVQEGGVAIGASNVEIIAGLGGFGPRDWGKPGLLYMIVKKF